MEYLIFYVLFSWFFIYGYIVIHLPRQETKVKGIISQLLLALLTLIIGWFVLPGILGRDLSNIINYINENKS